MADSLRDQLLKSGIVKQLQQDEKRQQPPPAKQAGCRRPRKGGKPHQPSQTPRPPRGIRSEIDLAKAYAIRAQTEASERKRVEQEAAEQARLRASAS
jgi:hypothetical protein